MLIALLLLAGALLGLALAAGVLLTRGRPTGRLPRLEDRYLVIHTVDGTSIQGRLEHAGPDVLTLADPRYLDSTEPARLGGQVLIARGKVDWIHHPRPEDLLDDGAEQ